MRVKRRVCLTLSVGAFIVGSMVMKPQELDAAMHRVFDNVAMRRALDEHGLRFTPQRGAVFEYLSGVTTHPTAEEVYRAVRRRLPRISLATVYKSLDALVAAGVATKLTGGDGSARYDCRGEDHYHLRDLATDEIHDLPVDFDPQLLAKLDPALVDRLRTAGFEVSGYRLEVLGRFAK